MHRKIKNAAKRISAVIFALTWFVMLQLVGCVDKDYISFETGMFWEAVNLIVMWISGRKAGALKKY